MRRMAWALAVLLGGLPGAARADLIFTNLGPGDSYDRVWGWAYGTTRPATDHFVSGDAFRAAATLVVDKVELPLWWVSDHAQIDVQLAADAGGGPGAVLDTFTLTTGTGTPRMALLSAYSALHPTLTAGAEYWLVVSSPYTNGGWEFGNSSGPHFSSDNGQTGVAEDAPQGAFRISGHPAALTVPEPPALLLAALGVVSLCGFAWRHLKSGGAARHKSTSWRPFSTATA
jgi:hypothetical protein